jgi:hypothetical protein
MALRDHHRISVERRREIKRVAMKTGFVSGPYFFSVGGALAAAGRACWLGLSRTPKLNSRKRTQRTQRGWDLKVSPAAIFAVFIFIIHLSCFAFFAFSRGNFGFRDYWTAANCCRCQK